MTVTMYDRPGRGQIWQTLNVIFAFSQVLIGFVGNVNGTNDRFTTTNAMTPNVARTPSIPVAVVAGSMAVLVTFALLRTRLFERLSVA